MCFSSHCQLDDSRHIWTIETSDNYPQSFSTRIRGGRQPAKVNPAEVYLKMQVGRQAGSTENHCQRLMKGHIITSGYATIQ